MNETTSIDFEIAIVTALGFSSFVALCIFGTIIVMLLHKKLYGKTEEQNNTIIETDKINATARLLEAEKEDKEI